MKPTPHRRYNPLKDEWVLVSAHRLNRPWQGEVKRIDQAAAPPYLKDCYLCPGNRRAGQHKNPLYKDIHIFPNDFPALLEKASHAKTTGILRQQPANGSCYVLCYSPEHNRTFSRMEIAAIEKVVAAWSNQVAELGEKYQYVQVFENKGALVGCSNDHPHGQIWACDYMPSEVAKEQTQQDDYYKTHGSCLLRDYLNEEDITAERIVLQNEHWTVLVPFWAYWPYETLLLPRQNLASLTQIDKASGQALATILHELVRQYDALFGVTFPYLMGWHGETRPQRQTRHRLLHCHFHPPLLRSASVRKYTAAFEVFAELQRDITPEAAAQKLKDSAY